MPNSVDPDQFASTDAKWSGPALFANPGSAGPGLRIILLIILPKKFD